MGLGPAWTIMSDVDAEATHAPATDEIVYEEVQLEDMEWCEDDGMYYYNCPCGDLFELSLVRCGKKVEPRVQPLCLPLPLVRLAGASQEDFNAGKRIARCPSCSLRIRVLVPTDSEKNRCDCVAARCGTR